MSRHVGIFGPPECGKTTAAKAILRERWRMLRRRAIVVDLNGDAWPAHCLVFNSLDRALAFAWRVSGCDFVIDDASGQIYRDAGHNDLFTRIRHQQHTLFVIGHNATILLPIQREALGTLLLFRQSPKAIAAWVEDWAEPRIEAAANMRAYEFLFCKRFGAADGSHLVQSGRFAAP